MLVWVISTELSRLSIQHADRYVFKHIPTSFILLFNLGSFETRQGLRQEDVLSTLMLFNVVLEVIIQRANLQTTGTIYNKETQLLAYADDKYRDGRSQSAVRNAYLALEREAAKVVKNT
jgi:hypothetical protein